MNYEEIEEELIKSWKTTNGITSTEEILDVIKKKNDGLVVNICKIQIDQCLGWNITNESITNQNGSFFKIEGIEEINNDKKITQPIIIQTEIGYLGIICKKINGVLHFLMQTKIEPGNVNKIQISPTIQATKSNFEQKHGGRKPLYLEYFLNAEKYNIIVDQIQSEQASRFYKKRNRNIIIEVDDEVFVHDSHIWMTLGQIKLLMKENNLVNMDTRTVLSCLPLIKRPKNNSLNDSFLYNSIFSEENELKKAYRKLNNYKMFSGKESHLIPLSNIKDWSLTCDEYVCDYDNNFKIIFAEIEIEGREVRKWCQPLVEATGEALFGLIISKFDDKYKALVKVKSEIGSFDTCEFGPTIQNESLEVAKMPINYIESVFLEEIKNKEKVMIDVIQSEEGGRFYHEQNRNVIVEINKDLLNDIPDEYLWLNIGSIIKLIQSNNVVNIQLRNLISLLEDKQ